MKKILSLLAMTALAGPAFAADAIIYEEPAAVVVQDYAAFNWTGGYIGAHAGYGWGKTRDTTAGAPEKKLKGGLGGIQAGYNWQFDNNLVLGAEADVSFGNIKKSWNDMDHGKDPWSSTSTYYTEDKIRTHGTVRARLGYAVDRFLPYVTGGLAWADTKHTLGCWDKSLITPAPGTTPSSSCNSKTGVNGQAPFEKSKSKNVFGYSVGAGAEYAVTNNWTIKAEYLYSNYGKNKSTIVDPNITKPADMFKNERNFKTSLNEVRIGVNYKF